MWFQDNLNISTFFGVLELLNLTIKSKSSKFHLNHVEFLISAVKRRYRAVGFAYKPLWVLLYAYLRLRYKWK